MPCTTSIGCVGHLLFKVVNPLEALMGKRQGAIACVYNLARVQRFGTRLYIGCTGLKPAQCKDFKPPCTTYTMYNLLKTFSLFLTVELEETPQTRQQ